MYEVSFERFELLVRHLGKKNVCLDHLNDRECMLFLFSDNADTGARFTKHLKPKIFLSAIQFVWHLRKS